LPRDEELIGGEGFTLSRQDEQLYTAWSRQDPPDAWEIEHTRRIAAIQGKDNKFVTQYAVLFGTAAPVTTTPTAPAPIAPVPATPAPAAPTAPVVAPSASWTCGSKTTCSQMQSCEEAKFYLTTCGVKRLDGDGDGVPCTQLCKP
jgi:deoxyribonuclease-1